MNVARSTELGLKMEALRVSKDNKSDIVESEMLTCYSKLKELVPTVPQNKKLSKVALLQHVIDYILDLELTLEFHPAMMAVQPPQPAQKPLGNRTPLGESTLVNTVLNNQVCIVYFLR